MILLFGHDFPYYDFCQVLWIKKKLSETTRCIPDAYDVNDDKEPENSLVPEHCINHGNQKELHDHEEKKKDTC